MVDDISIGQSAVPCIRRQAETEWTGNHSAVNLSLVLIVWVRDLAIGTGLYDH